MNRPDELSPRVVDALIRREKLALTGRLLRGLVHNISGAVQMIRLPLDLLELKLADADAEEIRAKLGSAQNGLKRLADELGLMSHKSGQQQKRGPEVLDLAQTAREQLAFWKSHHHLKHEVELRFEPPVHPCLAKAAYGDVALAVNLIVANAVESLEAGGGKRLEVELAEASGGCSLSIIDSGPGPSPELGAAIFEPFVTDKGGDHDGLGLFLAQRALLPWGGRIVWDPADPTRFTIWLPQ